MRTGGVEVVVARSADVDHGGHFQLDHLLEELVPAPVGQRPPGPPAARGIGVEVAANHAQLVDATL